MLESKNNNFEHNSDNQQVVTKINGRPSSIYDNFDDDTVNLHNGNNKSVVVNNYMYRQSYTIDDKSPTQAHCLNTTVPQNITGQNIAGKHTPTRNSLRHSRMIVLNRNGRVPTKYFPAIIKYNSVTKFLVISVTISGIVLSLISIWLILWSPSIRHIDNPYWSAVPILVSGIVSLLFLPFCPKEYPCKNLSCWYQPIKIFSIFTSVIALLAAFAVCIFDICHLILLSVMTCTAQDHLKTSCTCQRSNNSTDLFLINSFHYVDLNCDDVNDILYNLLIVSSAINGFVVVCLIIYLSMHWRSRDKIIYTKLRMREEIFYSKTSS